MSDGKLFELQPDGKYYLFQVEYDHKNDLKNEIWPSKQVPVYKKIISIGHTK